MARRWPLAGWLALAVVAGLLIPAAPGAAAITQFPGVELVDRRADGRFPDRRSDLRAMTPDGRYALIEAQGDGLAADDANGLTDAYVADLDSGALRRVSGPGGGAPRSITPDGRYVAWLSTGQLYLSDLIAGTVEMLPTPKGSLLHGLSDDGGVVLYSVPRPMTPTGSFPYDEFVLDRRTSTTVQVAPTAAGRPAGSTPRLSGDGSSVVFTSGDRAADSRLAVGETGLYRFRAATGAVELLVKATWLRGVGEVDRTGGVITVTGDGRGAIVSGRGVEEFLGVMGLTPDGRYAIVGIADASGARSLHRREVASGSMQLAVADAGGQPVTPSTLRLSADGSVIAFVTNAVVVPETEAGFHAYLRRIEAGTTELVCCNLSSPTRTADNPWPSNGGTRVAFQSWQKLDPEDTTGVQHVYAWDRPSVYFNAGDVVVDEHVGAATVPVRLSAPQTTATRVRWNPVGWWSPNELQGTGGVLEIPAGQTEGVIAVPVVDDDVHEATESYRLRVTSEEGAALAGKTTAAITIRDDDRPPAVSVADVTATEPAAAATWTLSLDRESELPVTVRWTTEEDTGAPDGARATAGADFAATTGTASFAPRQRSVTLDTSLFDDLVFEQDERFVLRLSDPAGGTIARGSAVGTIRDEDSLTPPAPRVTGESVLRARVSWDPVPAATSYRVHRATSEAGPYEVVATTTGTSVSTTVLPTRTYWFKLQTVGAGGSSALSAATMHSAGVLPR